jgi:hypothetical protein
MLDELDPDDEALDDDVAGAAAVELFDDVVELELEPQPAMAIEPTIRAPVMSRRIVLPASAVSIECASQ